MTLPPEVRVIDAASVSVADLDAIKRLFDATYERANLGYLERSLAKLRYLSLAEVGDQVVGFAIGDALRTPLAGCTGLQAVALAGISCIDDDYRRQGMFSKLSIAAMSASGAIEGAGRFLFAGRMAHPITYRTMASRSDTTVPRAGREMTPWHKDVGRQVADLYGVVIDPDTFVVMGDGSPIGFPRLQYETTAGEEELFRPVDRSRGDSLLAVSWMPDAPAGW